MSKKKRFKKGRRQSRFFKVLSGTAAGLAARVIPIVLFFFAAGGLFFGVRQILYADTQLQIKSILVDPPASLSVDLRKGLESKYLGKNLLSVDLEKIGRDLEKDPQIRTARVIRRFPSYLSIQIERRRSIGVIQFSPKGKWGLIAEDGVILEVLAKPPQGSLVIEALQLDDARMRVGGRVREEGFHRAVMFLRGFHQYPLAKLQSLTKISFDYLGSVTIRFGTGPEIRLGRNPLERIAALEKVVHLLESDEGSKIEYIDLQFDHVIVKKKGSSK